jgi:hypothetical protein
MNTKALAFVLVVVVACSFAPLAWADSVETWDGMLFEGTIVAGIPDVLTMDDAGVAVSIRRTAILDISFNEGTETARVTTTTGKGFEDRVLTSIGTVTIRTSSGETEVPNAQIRQIRFPYTQTESPTYDTTVYLLDGRTYEGNLTSGFPTTISIESGGITSNVRVDRIISMSFGGIDRIETRERVHQGNIVSDLPETIRLSTKYGELGILRVDVDRMTFSQEVDSGSVAAGEATLGLGAGLKMLGQLPIAFLQLRIGGLVAEAGVGFGAGALVVDAIGKYRLTLVSRVLYLYAGGGVFGVPGAGMGLEVLGGGEFSLAGLVDVPLSLFGGADLLSIGGITVTGWHFGVRWDF